MGGVNAIDSRALLHSTCLGQQHQAKVESIAIAVQ